MHSNPNWVCFNLWVVPVWHNFPMCGRYRLSRRKQIIEEHFASISEEQEWEPRYNVAPSNLSRPSGRIRRNPNGNCRKPARDVTARGFRWIPVKAPDPDSSRPACRSGNVRRSRGSERTPARSMQPLQDVSSAVRLLGSINRLFAELTDVLSCANSLSTPHHNQIECNGTLGVRHPH